MWNYSGNGCNICYVTFQGSVFIKDETQTSVLLQFVLMHKVELNQSVV